MNPELSPQQAHDLLQAVLLCRSARDEVSGFKTVIAEYEEKLDDAKVKQETALAKRSEFLAGISSEVSWDDDGELIAVLEGFEQAQETCETLRLTIKGQAKLLAEAEKRLENRRADRAQTIARINAEG